MIMIKDALGAHLSFDRRNPEATFKEAAYIGANSFQIFTKPPKKLFAVPFPKFIVKRWKKAWKDSGIDKCNVFAHSGYLINLAKREANTQAIIEEAQLCEQLGIRYLVVHPGSNTIGDYDQAISNIVHNLKKCIAKVPKVTLLLETMYKGKIGATFNELGTIIRKVKKNIGVCMDTAHMHIAGYVFHTEILMRKLMMKFKLLVGAKYLKMIHVNNTLLRAGSKRDEHVSVTIGRIPLKLLRAMVHKHLLKPVPYILETHAEYKSELKALRCIS
jgi:apurinic endonuclease APN1